MAPLSWYEHGLVQARSATGGNTYQAAESIPAHRWRNKPYVRPAWMTAEEFASLPLTLTVRECRYEVTRPCFRARTVTVIALCRYRVLAGFRVQCNHLEKPTDGMVQHPPTALCFLPDHPR